MNLVGFTYLAVILFSIGGLTLLDARHKIAFFVDAHAASLAVALGTAVLLGWDAIGIALGIFFRGQTTLLTGVMLGPELPLEEPLFLVLNCYTTLLVFESIRRRLARRGEAQ